MDIRIHMYIERAYTLTLRHFDKRISHSSAYTTYSLYLPPGIVICMLCMWRGLLFVQRQEGRLVFTLGGNQPSATDESQIGFSSSCFETLT
jgi:hypothetical protein